MTGRARYFVDLRLIQRKTTRGNGDPFAMRAHHEAPFAQNFLNAAGNGSVGLCFTKTTAKTTTKTV
ncbi:MAG: hypothetical protein VYB05_14970 [Pseudomonadota bacterium]|nr:hypothetical protein [Pseudomonadota bacterium]